MIFLAPKKCLYLTVFLESEKHNFLCEVLNFVSYQRWNSIWFSSNFLNLGDQMDFFVFNHKFQESKKHQENFFCEPYEKLGQ